MKRTLLILAACLVLSTAMIGALALLAAAQADPASTPAIDWPAVTAADLTAIHDLLRDNSPATVVDRDSAHFRRWLEEGLQKCRQRVPAVHDANGYGYLLSYYANGFHDSHIGFGESPASKSRVGWSAVDAWPGFMLGLRRQGYTVVYASPKASDIPPVGAILVSCDGHSPDAMVAERDGYDGDLSLESGRIRAAPDLLLDRGNPFVPRPVQCVFRSAGVDHSYTLHWQPMELAQWPVAAAASLDDSTRTLGIQRWGDRSWWLTIPSMRGNLDWNSFYHSIDKNLAAIRKADRVVIDLRGNGGGDSSFGERLVAMLWGQEFVDRYRPALGPTIWRASKLNRDYWATEMKQASTEPSYSAEEKAEMNSILAEYDKAITEGKPTFEIPGAMRPKFFSAAEPNPMHGRVMVLTNDACNSACLDTMDLLMALPGVVQAGTTTSADTIFMELTIVDPLPSGRGMFAFGHKAWIERPRGSNKPYTPAPALTWQGEPNDEDGFKAWLNLTVPLAK